MSSRREYPQSRPSKYKWSDGEGRLLSAGGLLPYDDNGIWVIEERRNGGPLEWNDIGGKYEPEDGDIFTTIAREFCEELYNSTGGCLTRNVLKRWVKGKMCKVAYVNGYKKQPVYVAYCVSVSVLKTIDIKMNPEKFQRRRTKVVKQNPHVPEAYYGAMTLRYIPFTSFHEEIGRMSFRLRKVAEVITPVEYASTFKKTPIEVVSDIYIPECQASQFILTSSVDRDHIPRRKKSRYHASHQRQYVPPKDEIAKTFTPRILKRGEMIS
jgi:hypothetical protein